MNRVDQGAVHGLTLIFLEADVQPMEQPLALAQSVTSTLYLPFLAYVCTAWWGDIALIFLLEPARKEDQEREKSARSRCPPHIPPRRNSIEIQRRNQNLQSRKDGGTLTLIISPVDRPGVAFISDRARSVVTNHGDLGPVALVRFEN